jgi:hypothetical protein
MNITEEHKATLNSTLELAVGLDKVSQKINPSKKNSSPNGLISRVSREIQSLHPSRGHPKEFLKVSQKFLKRSSNNKESSSSSRNSFKQRLSKSIKNINTRLIQSKAGKNTVGRLLNDQNLSFSDSVERSISRENSPCPKALPFVSYASGKTEAPTLLPEFKEYLKKQGSDYLKRKEKDATDELVARFEKASEKISKFKEFLEARTKSVSRYVSRKNTRQSFLHSPLFKPETNLQKSPARSQASHSKPSIQGSSPEPKVFSSIQSFQELKSRENQKFLDILNKIDLDRPKNLKEKAHLIQQDQERFRDHIYSLHKFEGFRMQVENSRKERQDLSRGQGIVYMKIIENFRLNKYRPTQGELEILEFWRKMVGFGWMIRKKDVDDIRKSLCDRRLNSLKTESLLVKFSSAL